MTVSIPEEPAMEALRKQLAAISLELRNTENKLTDANDDLALTQDELEDTETKLEDTEAKLKDAEAKLEETQLKLQRAEVARANSDQARQAANRERVLMRPPRDQEVFVVLKFQLPQPLPDGGYRLFTVRKKAIDRTLRQFIADKPEFGAAVMQDLRFEGSPRGQFVYQHMKDDEEAPIEFSRRNPRNFALKAGHTEDEMVAYITSVFNTHTQA
ncbi:hypothetical protein BGZ58_003644 [Dissophora ornata]|nr:hypothetical protein BGZ58_003644 [Dissophora ornata]